MGPSPGLFEKAGHEAGNTESTTPCWTAWTWTAWGLWGVWARRLCEEASGQGCHLEGTRELGAAPPAVRLTADWDELQSCSWNAQRRAGILDLEFGRVGKAGDSLENHPSRQTLQVRVREHRVVEREDREYISLRRTHAKRWGQT